MNSDMCSSSILILPVSWMNFFICTPPSLNSADRVLIPALQSLLTRSRSSLSPFSTPHWFPVSGIQLSMRFLGSTSPLLPSLGSPAARSLQINLIPNVRPSTATPSDPTTLFRISSIMKTISKSLAGPSGPLGSISPVAHLQSV